MISWRTGTTDRRHSSAPCRTMNHEPTQPGESAPVRPLSTMRHLLLLYGTALRMIVAPPSFLAAGRNQIMNEHDQKLCKALQALVDMARANWPRGQDVTISIPGGASAHGSVTIPVHLLERLLKEARP